jgi:hypothetical protein
MLRRCWQQRSRIAPPLPREVHTYSQPCLCMGNYSHGKQRRTKARKKETKKDEVATLNRQRLSAAALEKPSPQGDDGPNRLH